MHESERAWWMTGLAVALTIAAFAGRPLAFPRMESRAPASGAARLLYGEPLDLDLEAAESLEALPGIGPTRARAIVEARPLCAVADLDRVPGIGPRTLERLRPLVRTGGHEGCKIGPDPGD